MSRIYKVTEKKTGTVARWVRAANLNSAIRAHAHELVESDTASADDIVTASAAGKVDILDASADE